MIQFMDYITYDAGRDRKTYWRAYTVVLRARDLRLYNKARARGFEIVWVGEGHFCARKLRRVSRRVLTRRARQRRSNPEMECTCGVEHSIAGGSHHD
jgi:hypothetical protein